MAKSPLVLLLDTAKFLGKYVTLDTAQSITASKTFTAPVIAPLKISGLDANNNALVLDNSACYGGKLVNGTETGVFRISVNDDFQFGDINAKNKPLGLVTNGSTRQYITAAGLIGFGTTTPGGKVQIANGTAATYATRGVDLMFSRSDLQTTYLNVISNSYSATQSAATMNFEVNSGSATRAVVMTLDGAGRVGIGTTPSAGLDMVGSALRMANVSTNVTNKQTYVLNRHYTNAEEDVSLIVGTSSAAANTLRYGGGSGSYNAATELQFYTASNITTLTGTLRAVIDASGNMQVGGTGTPSGRMDIHGAGTTTGVCLQTADSGGNAKFTIQDGGNVGIGTTSISGLLHLAKNDAGSHANAPYLYIENTGTDAYAHRAYMVFRTKDAAGVVADATIRAEAGVLSFTLPTGNKTLSIAGSHTNTTLANGDPNLRIANTDQTANNWQAITFGDSDTSSGCGGIYSQNTDHTLNYSQMVFATRGANGYGNRMSISSEGVIVLNDGGQADSDFRVEGDTDQDLLFTDASADRVGIGTNAPTDKFSVAAKFDVNASGIITKYNNIATEDYGVPAVVDGVALTAQTADITATNCTNANVAGTYRVSYYLQVTTADILAGSAMVTFGFTDNVGATTISSVALLLTGTGRTSGVFYAKLASGNLTYSTSHTGIFGSSAYSLDITVERLR